MSVTVTRTKILVPNRRADLLSRPRLLSMLDDLLDYPFTLISAPAGYGKTSLLIDLAHQAAYPSCWYSLDLLDNDPKRFLTHLISAIQIQFPEFGSSTLSLLDNLSNPLSNQDQLVSTLVNEIYENISEHYVLFLDDFHLLENNSEINTFISRFGQEMDANTHLVIASRTLFDFPDLPLLIGRKMVKGIGFEDLAFLPREIKSYYDDILERSITDEESCLLVNQTEGWITGLLLSANLDIHQLPSQDKARKVTGTNMFTYLAEQVFEKQDYQIQDFLLKSSIFDSYNAELCKHILGSHQSGSWEDTITYLLQNNLFTQQVKDESIFVRYHHLFREFLQKRFRDQNPDEEQILLSKLIERHKDNKSWENAFNTAKYLGDPTTMAEVIDLASSSLFHQGRISLLSSWLNILPESGFKAYPQLYSLQGYISTELGKIKIGLRQLNSALKQPEIVLSSNLLAQCYTWRSTANRLLGNYPKALEDGNLVHKMSLSGEVDYAIAAEALREIGLSNARIGNFKKSISTLNKSLSMYSDSSDTKNAAQVESDLGHVHLQTGNLTLAEFHFKNSLSFWAPSNNKNMLSTIMNNLGNLSLLTGNYSSAFNWITKSKKLSTETSNNRLRSFSIASLGDLALTLGLFTKSTDYYQNSRSLAEKIQEGFLLTYLELSMATACRYLGKLDRAQRHLNTAHNFISQGSSQNELGAWHLENGFLLLANHLFSQAQDSFNQAQVIFRKTDQSSDLAKTFFGLGFVDLEQDNHESAVLHVQTGLSLLYSLESIHSLLPELNNHHDQILALKKNSPLNSDHNNLLKELGRYQDTLPLLQKEIFPQVKTVIINTPTLDIKALGKIQVLLQGNLIRVSEWIHQKTVRELFFYLLNQPRGVQKEQVGLVFWPDSSPSQLTCQFKNAIYRLRRAIGRDSILYNINSRSYLFNQEIDYRYDVDIFLSTCKSAKNETEPDPRTELYRQAISLYTHPFGPQLDGVWTEPIRRKLYLEYEQASLSLAAIELDNNQTQACLEICEQLINIDPCQEEAYQFSMQAYAAIDDRTNLIRLYEECKDNLSLHLGISPSGKTESLFLNLSR